MIVPKNKIRYVVDIINKYKEVTHNYERNYKYNIWFTIVARDRKQIEKIIKEIKCKTKIKKIVNIPAKKTFKISFEI
jgi:DNA-binding Lrp family transcriptional regulator